MQDVVFSIVKMSEILKPDKEGHSAWEKLLPVLEKHWTEIARFKEILKLEPHIQRYVDIERSNRLHFVMALRNQDIIGYSIHFIVNGHPHYKNLKFAEDDIHYIHPDWRGTGLHEEMRKYALAGLRQRGVDFVTARTKVGHQHDATLRRIGFEPMDQVYGLNLREWKPE